TVPRARHAFPTRRSSELGSGGTPAPNGCVLAGGELLVRRTDLSARQSAPEGAAASRAREAAATRALGHDPGAQFHLRPPEPDHRSEDHTSELQSRENLVC